MQIEELNGTPCKTYLLTSGKDAALIDPVRERLDTYRMVLGDRGLTLRLVIETHTHADHLMLGRAAKEALLGTTGALVMHRASPSPLVDRHVDEGETLSLGDASIKVIASPGHTPDSMMLSFDGAVLTGDTMLIGGSGRTDFPGGDAGAQYDVVTTRLFALPDATIVYPGHDYKGRTTSTIGDEKASNPRFFGKTREEYIALMGALGLPFPEKIQRALQVNQSGFEEHEIGFAPVADIAAMPELTARELASRLRSSGAPLLLDVREPEEFVGPLGHVEGALLVPLDALAGRLPKLTGYVDREVVVLCRAGARSASAGAILKQAGFTHVTNLAGGMLAWVAEDLPVQR
jgi:glyoxylase-like metal-dependent hydrolase (beta-lactamase superfamily II)/rhodanese-related sulfurtransferase